MTQPQTSRSGGLSVEELVALCDEIAALCRAGVPLEAGVAALASDMPGRMGRSARRLAERVATGRSLAEAMAEEPKTYPPLVRAVVEAGTRSGRLTAALEGLATTGRRLAEACALIGAALLYPLVVVALAVAFVTFYVAALLPTFLDFIRDVGGQAAAWLEWLEAWQGTAWIWGGVVLVLLAAVGLAWWIAAGRMALRPDRGLALIGWLPWTRRMMGLSRTAAFADLLALLVENGLPLGEALRLAGEACGSRRLAAAARKAAVAVERGEPLATAIDDGAVPPVLKWLLGAGGVRPFTAASVRFAADGYHRQAAAELELAHTLAPVVLTLVLGGTATLAAALLLFVPWIMTMREIAM